MVGKRTFVGLDNRKTVKEAELKTVMGEKRRFSTIYDTRNGLGIVALGDKNFKAPEYETGFFREGGLITG